MLHFGRANPLGFNKAQKAVATVAAAFIANLLEKDRLLEENQRLQERERWWRIAFDILFRKISGPCCIIDEKDGLIYQANEAFAALLQKDESRLEGQPLAECFVEADRQRLAQALADPLAEEPRRLKGMHLKPSETTSTVINLRLAKIPNTPHVLVRVLDSTARRRLQARMLRRWHTLNRIFAHWQRGSSRSAMTPAIDKGLRLLGESLKARYVVFFRVKDQRMKRVSMMNLDFMQKHQPSQAWRAGLEKAPYEELLQDSGMTFYANLLESEVFAKWRPIARQLGCASVLSIPLRVSDEPLGLVCLYFAQKARLHPIEREFVQACSTYLTTVLDRFRAHQLAQRRTEHIRIIEELTNRINADFDLPEVIRATAESLSRSIAFDLMDITLFDSEGEKVKLYSIISRRLAERLQLDDWTAFSEQHPMGWLCRGEAGDAEVHARIEDLVDSRRNVLLMANDKYLGTLEVSCMDANAYSKSTVEFLGQIAGQLAIAIENARLFEKLNLRVRELSAIARASWAAAADLDAHSMITNVAQSLQKALAASAVWYQLIYRLPDIPERVAVGAPVIELDPARHAEVADRLLNQKQYAALDRENDGALKLSRHLMGVSLLVPVVLHHQTVGFLTVEWAQTRKISRREIELVRTMANLVSTAIENERLRQESARRTGELERVNDELEKFVYTVSHDLKSPIVSIQGFASILMEDYAESLDADARHYLERIQKNAQAMERLVKDLLELSRIGRSAQHFERLNSKEIVERALIEFSYQIKQDNIIVEVQEDLPEVVGDATQLTQVFANLIGNAIKFMDPDKVEYRIEIGGRREDDAVILWVKDNGVGIAPEYRERIFNLFERVAQGRTIEGSGVGLTIVKRIVEQHKGQIWVESRPREGATFFIKLPAVQQLPENGSSPRLNFI